MKTELLEHFLPEKLLDHFDVTEIQKLGNIKEKRHFIEVYLEEKNVLPNGFNKRDYESKGFLPPKKIQDFPIRGKAVYLIISRRRWRHKDTKKEIKSDFSFIAEGSKLTEELAAFLKGRD